MSKRNLLRHVFRHGPRGKVDEDASPLGLKMQTTKLTTHAACETSVLQKNQSVALSFPPKTPESFGLEDIAEELTVDTPSSAETASLTETLGLPELEISTFSMRELIHATLDEAKSAISSHLDTINITLALLEALDGFSATITEIRKEIMEKKQACEEQMGTLEAVERAIEGMAFAGEPQEQDVEHDDAI